MNYLASGLSYLRSPSKENGGALDSTGSAGATGAGAEGADGGVETSSCRRPEQVDAQQRYQDAFEFLRSTIDDLNLVQADSDLKEYCDDRCLKRFIRANGGDAAAALHQLRSVLEWRQEQKPQRTFCPKCAECPTAHNMRLVGTDVEGRPVLYSCFGQAFDRWDPDVNSQHLEWVLESTLRWIRRTNCAKDQWLIVSDYHGFGMSDCSPSTMMKAKTLMDRFPESLFKIFMVDAPYIFSQSFNVVKPIVPQDTKDKMAFVTLEETKAELLPLVGEDLYRWLRAEMEENRDPAINQTKRYWEFLDKETGEPRAHDARGMAHVVQGDHYDMPCLSRHFEWSPAPPAMAKRFKAEAEQKAKN